MGFIDKLADISSGSIVILELPPEENQIKRIAELLKYKMKSHRYGIFISANRPINNLIKKVKEYGYDFEKDLKNGRIWLIDSISKNVGDSEIEEAVYVSSPSDIPTIKMEIERALSWIKGKKGEDWIILDSLATLLIFNDPEALLKFIHYLFGKIRVLGLDAFIFTLNEGIDLKVRTTIKQLSDSIIKM